MFVTYFEQWQWIGLAIMGIIYLVSLFFYCFKDNIEKSVIILFIGGLIGRILIINFDPFLHIWDEQFHALVAKNMAEGNPFVPLLYKHTPLPYDPLSWVTGHVWLHKQPVFLWQMALSIKIFGANEFAVRLPSAIMGSLLILVIYRIGSLLVNKNVGYLGSLMYTVSGYLFDFVTGTYTTDHNDLAFIFYITLSIWMYVEYINSRHKKYIWLIGLFAGIAILNKWLVGLLVYSGWGLSIIFLKAGKEKWDEAKNLLKSLFICCIVFLPWQIYILIVFPEISRYELEYNSRHFYEVVEGHSGDAMFHLEKNLDHYGKFFAYILPFAFILLLVKIKNKYYVMSIATYVIVTYVFYTIAKSKMSSFTLIVAPLLFISLGNFLFLFQYYLTKAFKNEIGRSFLLYLILIAVSIISLNIEKIQSNHTSWEKHKPKLLHRIQKTSSIRIADKIRGNYEENKTVIFNTAFTDNIIFMFYSGIPAYDRKPTESEIDELLNKGFKILYVHDFQEIPSYIADIDDIEILSDLLYEEDVLLETERSWPLYINTENANILAVDTAGKLPLTIFTIMKFGSGKIAIQTKDGSFLCAELFNNEEIAASRERVGLWELFEMDYIDEQIFRLKAANNQYIVYNTRFQFYAKGDKSNEAARLKFRNIKD